MTKKKKIIVNCSICRKHIEIEVPIYLSKNREYYPFEYINIHGSPEHALMLFLDQDLVVRDTMVYKDINMVKNQGKVLSSLIRMSEFEAFASIYNNPLRLKLLTTMTKGPITENNLIEVLKQEEGFLVEDLNVLMLPLIKTGLVKTSWLNETFFECYFLIMDFLPLKIPSKLNIKKFSEDLKFKKYSYLYFKKLDDFFQKYQYHLLSEKNNIIEDIKFCLKLITDEKYTKILRILRNGPQNLVELAFLVDTQTIKELINKEIIFEFTIGNTKYYALIYEVKIIRFTPKYLLNSISKKLENKKISLEMAIKHLDLLYNSEIK